MKEELAEILAPYVGQRGATIPVLQKVQAKLGYLPEEALREVATALRMPVSEVYGVATFYAQFRFVPRGERTIKVCLGTACHVRGAQKVLETVETELGTEAGGTTADRRYSLEKVACFGSCGLAPVMVIEKDVHGRMNATKVKQVIKEDQQRNWGDGAHPKEVTAKAATTPVDGGQ